MVENRSVYRQDCRISSTNRSSLTSRRMDDDILANYEQLFSGRVNDVIPIVKFKSSLTGIQVVIALVEGPAVSGYFCVATEAEDDDGLPHTLEHLIFMGS